MKGAKRRRNRVGRGDEGKMQSVLGKRLDFKA